MKTSLLYLIFLLIAASCSPEAGDPLSRRSLKNSEGAVIDVALEKFARKVSADGLTTPPGYMPHAIIAAKGYLTFENLSSAPDDVLFTMIRVEGSKLEFATPISSEQATTIEGAELCGNASYSNEAPRFKNVPAQVGSYLACMRLTAESGKIIYFTTPIFSVAEVAPSEPVLLIEGGAKITAKAIVNLSLSVKSASEMYITNNVSCAEGGYWEPVAAKKEKWTLLQRNTKASVYAKFRNNIGIETSCVSATISHDSDYLKNVSITLNGGATATNSQTVDVDVVGADGASEMYVSNLATCSGGGSWEPFVNPRQAWVLGDFNSQSSVYLKVRDQAGATSACVSASITHDNIPPGGATIAINSGASVTSASSVTLSLMATGAKDMYITNTLDCAGGGVWEAFAASKSGWELAQSNGLAKVYAKFVDRAGNETACVSANILQGSQASTLGSLSINGGDAYTRNSEVSLSLSAAGATSVYITNTAGCSSGGVWEAMAATKSGWTLGQSNALTSVYAKYRFADTVGPCVSASITHDNIAPFAGSLVINSGATITNQALVPLDLSASGADLMKFTNAGSCSGSGNWIPFAALIPNYPLSYANAVNLVSVKFRDLAGNESSCITSSIQHNNIAPSGATIVLGNGSGRTGSLSTSVTTSVINATGMYITNTPGCTSGGSWEALVSVKSGWLLTNNNAMNTVYAKFRDNASNESACVAGSIIHDDIPPSGSVVINGGAASTSSAAVILSLTATDATESYITNQAGCGSGGSWTAFATTASWTLPLVNASNSVYVKYRDATLNESICLASSIDYYEPPTIAVVGSPFSYTAGNAVTITPTLGASVNAVSIAPALANGLSLNTSNGVISGTATGVLSASSYTLTASNQLGQTATTTLSLTIYAPPTISVTGSPFTFTRGVAIANITPSLGSSVTGVSIAPALPSGLAFNSTTGEISGTASVTSAPAVTYTLTASNAIGATASATLDLRVNDVAPSISVAGSPFKYTTGNAISITPSLSSSVSSVTIAPALGNGLSINATSGVISGSATGSLPPTAYTLTASNSTGQTASALINLAIYALPSIAVPGSPFSYVKNSVITNITPTIGSSVTGVSITPALPTGLAINGTTGVVSGTPTVSSSPAVTYTLTASNDAGATATTTFDMLINEVGPGISVAGSPFKYTTGDVITITPSLDPSVESVAISPALANGLSMNTTTGEISGTTTGTLTGGSFTLTASNSTGQTATAVIEINIYAPPTIGVTGSPFTFTKSTAISNIAPSLGSSVSAVGISPTLPAGLTLNTTSGVISGTPSGTSAATSYTLTASNAAGATATTSISITVNDIAPTISVAGSPFKYTSGAVASITPTLGSSVSSVAISPALSNGLSMNTTTGVISGTTSATLAATTYTLTASNSTGQTATTTISIGIYAAPTISVSGSPFTYTKGSAIASITPTLGSSVTSVTISPSLPTGLALNSTTGVVSGTPSVTSSPAVTYTLTAMNEAASTATTTLNITVNDIAPTISLAGSPFKYTTGNAVSLTPSLGSSVSSVAISPALANGLSMNTTTGVISGTASGTLAATSYTLTAANSTGQTATLGISIAIFAVPTISVAGSPFTYTKNSAISNVTPTLGSSVSSVAISPALPAGLSFNTTSGVVSGTPSGTSAAATYTLTASNEAGATATTTLSITVNDIAPTISVAGSPFRYTTGNVASITPTLGSSVSSVSISPALSNGLSMNTTTGVISGTTTTTLAPTSYTLTASNSTGQTANVSISIAIYAPPTISVTGSPFTFTKSSAISNITPSLGSSVISVSISPALPAGLTLNTTSGVISGTPSGTSATTSYTLTASNTASATATTSISITVNDIAPTISVAGSPFKYTTGAVASITPTLGSSVSSVGISPALSNGLSMNTTTGVISGTTSTTLAATTYTLTASNSTGQTATTTISIGVYAPPIANSISISGGASYTASTSVSLSLAASNASSMYITNTASCGGTVVWEAYATSKAPYTLGQTNGVATVYVRFANEAGSVSSCISASITHDGIAPTPPSSFVDGASALNKATSPLMTWVAGSDAGSGISNYQVSVGTSAGLNNVLDWTNVGNVSSASVAGMALTTDTTYYATIRSVDGAGNVSTAVQGDGFFMGWYQEAFIKAANAQAGDSFGRGFAIDGDTLAVGAHLEDSDLTTITNASTHSSNESRADSGAVYVYKRTGSSWAQQAFLKASNAFLSDRYGVAVDISGDTLAVGAFLEDKGQSTITNGTGSDTTNGPSDAGAVYIYNRSGSIWTQQAYVKPPNPGGSDEFGESLSLSGDTLAVVARFEDSDQTIITNGTTAPSDNNKPQAGAVYVFKRTGTTWAQEAFIKAANNKADDIFGERGVSLDGDTLAVAHHNDDSDLVTITNGTTASTVITAADSGAVFVYKRTGTIWAQEAYVKAANAEAGDHFGYTARVSGNSLAVGARWEASNQITINNGTATSANNSQTRAGAVYVYARSGTTWAQQAYIKANRSRVNELGTGLAFEGDILVAGAPFDVSARNTITNNYTVSATDDSGVLVGAAYLYRRTGVNWALTTFIKASGPLANYAYGANMDISGTTLIVSLPSEASNQMTITNGPTASTDTSVPGSGAVYIYRK